MRNHRGAEVWLVAIKCTFDILPDGNTCVATEQPPVMRVPEYIGDPGQSSLRYESDLILTKLTTDVLLNGHAYAPGARPATIVDVGFRVGPLIRVAKVFGDRLWRVQGLCAAMSERQPFIKMPLVWERAFGGWDKTSPNPKQQGWEPRNPVGTGFAVDESHLDGMLAPNIEDPKSIIQGWNDHPVPLGFGPIGPHWTPRSSFAGTYDDEWVKQRQPLSPKDFDDRFFQCAPPAQQTEGFLLGGEPVALKNLTQSGQLFFNLPRLFFGFETRFYSGPPEMHRAKLHTVILEPDYPRVSLIFHTALECHARAQKLARTIVVQKKIPWAGPCKGAPVEAFYGE